MNEQRGAPRLVADPEGIHASDQRSATMETEPRLGGKRSRGARRGHTGDIALGVVALIAVAAALGAHTMLTQRPAAPKASPIVRLVPTSDALNCVTQVAWSPDSTLIAALGDEEACGASPASQASLIYIYDARSGKVAQKLHPDTLVLDAPAIKSAIAGYTGSTSGPPTVTYESLTWTPDGQALILPFAVIPSLREAGSPGGSSSAPGLGDGVLRLAVSQSASSAVMLDTLTQLPKGDIERWNLDTDAPEAVPAPPAAAAYRWNSDGTLAVAGSAVGQPIGEPNSGQTFTIWQPGSLQYEALPPGPSQPLAVNTQNIEWNANFAAVSPDGRYFYPSMPSSGSLVPPTTKQVYPAPQDLAPHDAALLALAQQMTQATAPSSLTRMLVAWRPDGRLMAALPANSAAPATASAFTVALYDTGTGKVVARLTPNLNGLLQGDGGNETLAWSPDGSRLLLMDNVYGSITIWGPGALP